MYPASRSSAGYYAAASSWFENAIDPYYDAPSQRFSGEELFRVEIIFMASDAGLIGLWVNGVMSRRLLRATTHVERERAELEAREAANGLIGRFHRPRIACNEPNERPYGKSRLK